MGYIIGWLLYMDYITIESMNILWVKIYFLHNDTYQFAWQLQEYKSSNFVGASSNFTGKLVTHKFWSDKSCQISSKYNDGTGLERSSYWFIHTGLDQSSYWFIHVWISYWFIQKNTKDVLKFWNTPFLIDQRGARQMLIGSIDPLVTGKMQRMKNQPYSTPF